MKNISILLLLILPFVTFSQAPTSGLVAYYPLDGGAAIDASGNNRNGNLSGGITQTANRYGEDGKALMFDGINGSIVVSNWNILTGNASRSMSLWFKTSGYPPLHSVYLIWGASAVNQTSWLGTYTSAGNKLLHFSAGSVNIVSVSNQPQYYDNSWHNMIVTSNGTTIKLYLDGVEVGSLNGTLNTASSSLFIGRFITASDYFKGALDDIRIYNRALSHQEIQTMYLSEVPSQYNTELVKIGSDRFIHNTGVANTYMGVRAGLNTNGSNNTFYGFESGQSGSSGDNNTFVGTSAGKVNVGSANTFIGTESGLTNTSGGANTYLGHKAGNSQNTSMNVMIGAGSGQYSETGDRNVYIGYQAGYGNSNDKNVGQRNVNIGWSAGYKNTTGNYNTLTGYQSGFANQTGISNTFYGYNTASSLDGGNHNTLLGYNVGQYLISGNYNTYLGSQSGRGAASPNQNTGSSNSVVGYAAGYKNTTGSENSFFGYTSGYFNTIGSKNTFIGREAGFNSTTGTNNTFIGHESGLELVSGSNNTFIGRQANSIGSSKAILQYSAAIGAEAKVSVNNAIVLGDTIRGIKVGIGMTNPQYPLDVKGVVNMRIGFNSPGIKINGNDFMGLDQDGEYWVSNFKMKYSDESQWADKVFTPSYEVLALNNLSQFIHKNGHLPGIPSASDVVQNGVEIQKIIPALLAKIEELSLYLIDQQKAIDIIKSENTELQEEVKKLKAL
ncbi:LamG-like jellyroll fold domain-containing protein [Lacihabitans lacunae]|uniref:LamG-like jellyroll fold domain-containing protein n=1 Tax=Lacihabitans lacunae TaxID=1028214 RepID=A0ABV7YZV1_9BACT